MDEQCSLTSYENMGAALQRTTSCAMTFCKWPPSVRTTRKISGCGALALPQCPACSRDAQAAFIWECMRTIWMSEGTLWHMSKQNQNTQYATSANSGLRSEILYFENELISAVLLLKQKKKKICTVTTRSGVTEPTSVFSSSHVCTDLFCPKRSFPATSDLKG